MWLYRLFNNIMKPIYFDFFMGIFSTTLHFYILEILFSKTGFSVYLLHAVTDIAQALLPLVNFFGIDFSYPQQHLRLHYFCCWLLLPTATGYRHHRANDNRHIFLCFS